MKLTKQGVRDLNTLPGKSPGVRLPPAPKQVGPCRHPLSRARTLESGHVQCLACDAIVYDPYYGDYYYDYLGY